MTDICLLIDDAALREAVAEQLILMTQVVVHEATSLPAAPAPITLADDAAATRLNLAVTWDAPAAALLLLGTGAGCAARAGVEIFAKPVTLGVLLDRIQYHLHVVPRLRPAQIAFGAYRLEPQNRCVTFGDSAEIIRLTEKETALLEYLVQSAEPVSREDLLSAVWGYDDRIDTHTLETHIYHLRRKLDSDGARGEVLCNDGKGYYLKREGA